jgi:hypothetical protein
MNLHFTIYRGGVSYMNLHFTIYRWSGWNTKIDARASNYGKCRNVCHHDPILLVDVS